MTAVAFKTYRVSIPVMVAEEPNPDAARILSDAGAQPQTEHLALMVGFNIRAPSARDAALILYERLEGRISDP